MKPEDYKFPNVVRHVYDVDVFQILDELRDKYSGNTKLLPSHLKDLKFIEEEEETLVDFLTEDGSDLKENRKYRNFVIPSSHNMYGTYLGYKILTIDLYKIEPMLSYQSVLFLGNYYSSKDNFLGYVEFQIYDFVKKRNFLNENARLEKIVNWLERNRMFVLDKAYNKVESNNNLQAGKNTENKSLEFRKISMEPQFANSLYQKLEPYFSESQHPKLFDLILKGKCDEQLCFNGQTNQLAELFKRLRYNFKIHVNSNKILAKWLTDSFTFKNKQGGSEQFNIGTILQVLTKSKAEPEKNKRLFENLAPFVPQSLRKEKKSSLK